MKINVTKRVGEKAMANSIITIAIAALSAIGSSYVTYYFAIRSKREEAKLKSKEERYLKLLLLLQGFVGRNGDLDTQKEFFREYYQAWLYSSDEVIIAIKVLIDAIKSTAKNSVVSNGRELAGAIVQAMRKDLCGKTKLGKDAFEYVEFPAYHGQ